MPKLSLCMIVKNEEANLAACIRPVRGLVDDLVIVDTGSVDHTREIAREFGARLFEFPWCDDFSAARNESLRQARGEWVFWMDADDRLDDVNLKKLARLLGEVAEPAAYLMTILGDESWTFGGIQQLRLFKFAPDIRWEYRVHEQIGPALARRGYPLRETDIVVRHTGYRSAEIMRQKYERNLPLLLLDISEHPDEPIILFHLGMTYSLLARPAEAVPLLQRALVPMKPHNPEARFIFRYLVDSYRGIGRIGLALQQCLQGLQWFADDAYLQAMERSLASEAQNRSVDISEAMEMAWHYYQASRLQEAEQMYQAILQVHPNQVDALHLLGVIAGRTGRYDFAVDCLQAALQRKPELAAAHNSLGMVFVHQRKVSEAVACFRQAVYCQPDYVAALSNLGNALRELGQVEEAITVLQHALQLRPDSVATRNNLLIAQQSRGGE